MALGYGVLGLLLHSGAMPLALAGAAAVAMRTANTAVSTTVFAANRLFEHSFYLDLVTRCLAQARGYHRVTVGLALPRDPQRIEVCEVSFTYPGQDEPALKGVSVTILRGQVVALVGENGSGKSTLAKVITGLYQPDQGRVSWDGVDIAQVDPHELHSQVAVVLQNPTQWPMTAGNNIRIGRLECPDPDGTVLAAAAADSGADAVIAELPQGWDSVLSRQFHNGCDLSGGQWQRISVARGLYRDAALLIADEPTAAMDARAEHAVFQSLHALRRSDPLLRLIPATEDDRRLRTTEPFARPDLHRAVVLAIEHDEVQDLAPEPRQHLRVAATEHELTDTTCHKRNLLSAWELPGRPHANLMGSQQ